MEKHYYQINFHDGTSKYVGYAVTADEQDRNGLIGILLETGFDFPKEMLEKDYTDHRELTAEQARVAFHADENRIRKNSPHGAFFIKSNEESACCMAVSLSDNGTTESFRLDVPSCILHEDCTGNAIRRHIMDATEDAFGMETGTATWRDFLKLRPGGGAGLEPKRVLAQYGIEFMPDDSFLCVQAEKDSPICDDNIQERTLTLPSEDTGWVMLCIKDPKERPFNAYTAIVPFDNGLFMEIRLRCPDNPEDRRRYYTYAALLDQDRNELADSIVQTLFFGTWTIAYDGTTYIAHIKS